MIDFILSERSLPTITRFEEYENDAEERIDKSH
jgi:hypothetical protein